MPVSRNAGQPFYCYVACLECGKQFYYNSKEMQMGTAAPLSLMMPRHSSDACQSHYCGDRALGINMLRHPAPRLITLAEGARSRLSGFHDGAEVTPVNCHSKHSGNLFIWTGLQTLASLISGSLLCQAADFVRRLHALSWLRAEG